MATSATRQSRHTPSKITLGTLDVVLTPVVPADRDPGNQRKRCSGKAIPTARLKASHTLNTAPSEGPSRACTLDGGLFCKSRTPLEIDSVNSPSRGAATSWSSTA
ncbi:hypothetical protein GW17_00016673 [Ensete ventricosum]|nr:hypothetical protein GW17_00016673 [Ensete ventricosum]